MIKGSRRSRRGWRAGVGVSLALVLVAAACGGDDSSDTPDTTDAAATTVAGGATTTAADTTVAEVATTAPDAALDPFPVEVEHEFGTTVIDAEPTRVVSVGYTEQDVLLSVGVVPLAVTEWYGEQPYATWPWAQDELGDATPMVLSSTDGFEYEKIAALQPDLIVGTNAGIDAETYQQLAAIAPTIAQPKGEADWFSPWADQARLIGAALGRSAQMDAVIADIDAQFAAAAAEHPEFAGTKVVFLQNAIYDGSAIAYQDGLSTDFLTDLGFVVPSEIDAYETDGGQAYIPLENLSVLDAADVLLWATEAPADRTALETEPLYNALEEVQEGRLVFTDGLTAGALYFTSPLSLPFVLEQIVPALASTLAGDGPAVIAAG